MMVEVHGQVEIPESLDVGLPLLLVHTTLTILVSWNCWLL